ncbi:MAG TPA: hydantoinase B/oxoprolinase family protein [Candidatus Methylomirabilis sp.]|nr:hydantoinase B/oxoprolinase family protein [Candidatus Methylomirabilis sp.]
MDPVDLEICWSRLIAIVDEAAAALVRTSFSTVVRECNDFAVVLLDDDGAAVAQSTLSAPGFIGTPPLSLREFLKVHPKSTLEPGDVLLTNDPWIGTGHLPDSTIAAPIFHGRRLGGKSDRLRGPVGFVVTVAHLSDVGGRQWSADANEMFEEGVRIPVLKLRRRGTVDPVVLKILEANVRVPDQVLGDINAQMVAIELVSRRLLELLAEYDLPDLRRLRASIFRVSERALSKEIRALPAGTYTAEIEADGWDTPVRIRVAITIRHGRIHIDYTGSSPQSRYGINEVYNHTFAYSVYPLKCLLTPSIPNNDGFVSLFEVNAPAGLIVNCRPPAAVGARQLIGHLLQGAIFEAMAPILPARVQADSGTPLWTLVFRGLNGGQGESFSAILFFNGGTGAMSGRDGSHCTSFPSNIACSPAEIVESLAPLLVRGKRLAPDSGGPGTFTGGCGQIVEIESRWPGSVRVSLLTERTRAPARGLLGGQPGGLGFVRKNGIPVAETKGMLELAKGDVLELGLPGGGGVGSPEHRSPHALARDVTYGYVSREASRTRYGTNR